MAKARVLLVEDEPMVAEFLTDMLTMLSLEVVAVTRPGQALELLAGSRFDLVLTDLMLPEMNGCSLIRRIRAEHAQLPLVLISGNLGLGDGRACPEADLLLPKPLTFEHLREMVARLLGPRD